MEYSNFLVRSVATKLCVDFMVNFLYNRHYTVQGVDGYRFNKQTFASLIHNLHNGSVAAADVVWKLERK